MLKKTKDHLSSIESVVIPPHGTRAKSKTHVNIKSGIYALYKNLNIPIIPVYMRTGKVWDRKGPIKNPGIVEINPHQKISRGYKKDEFIRITSISKSNSSL